MKLSSKIKLHHKHKDLYLLAIYFVIIIAPIIFQLITNLRGNQEHIINWKETWDTIKFIVFFYSILILPPFIFPIRIKYWAVIYLPLYLVIITNYVYLIIFGQFIPRDAWAAFIDTNPPEALEFLNAHHLIYYLIVAYIVLPILFIYFIPAQKLVISHRKWRKILIAIFFATIILYPSLNGFKNIDHFQPFTTINDLDHSFKEVKQNQETTQARKALKPELTPIPRDSNELYVIVIGESARRKNLSLYGYPKKTTPNIDKRKNQLIVFSDVTSPSVQTKTSLKAALTPAINTNYDAYNSKASFIGNAQASGLYTAWISNQGEYSAYDTDVSSIAKETDEYYFLNATWSTNLLYDNRTLPLATQIISKRDKPTLLVVHLNGSHMNAKNRYPREFNHWDDETGTYKEKTINAYDNSIRFTDYVLEQIIAQLDTQKTPNMLLYFSDHATEMFDHGSKFYGRGSKEMFKEHVDVPLFVWCNQTFKAKNKELLKNLDDNKDKPVELQYLFDAMMTIMRIDSPDLKKNKSFADGDYIGNDNRKILRMYGIMTEYNGLK